MRAWYIRLEIVHRVDRLPENTDLEVQVRARGQAGGTDCGDRVAGVDVVADADVQRRRVPVQRRELAAVIDHDTVAVTAARARPHDPPGRGRVDRVAVTGVEVDTG